LFAPTFGGNLPAISGAYAVFNGANPTPADLNCNLPARQQGSSLGTVTWTKGAGNVQQTDGRLLIAGDGNSTSGLVSPDHAFNGADSASGLVIEIDMDPHHGTPGDRWLAINMGMSAANRWTGVNGGTSHLGVLFFPTGASAVYDGATVVGSFTSAVVANTFIKVALRLSDSIDGNPLDGVGETKLSIFVGHDPHLARHPSVVPIAPPLLPRGCGGNQRAEVSFNT
jgi:hypothetical protein